MTVYRLRSWVILALWLGAVVPQSASAARWFDSLPADDPDTVVRHNASGPNASPPPPPASGSSGIVGGVVGAAGSLLWGIAGTLGTIASGAREAVWETAYMFGINTTPMPHTPMADQTADLAMPSPSDRLNAVPAESAAPSVTKAPVVPPAAAVADTPPPAPPAKPTPQVAGADANTASDQPGPIDPGLLANFIYDRGNRRPDGSFFVPKPLQRLFNVRTARTVGAEVPVTLELAGRIVPDPHTEADVEASLLGRIDPPEAGLPVLGDVVTKGQVLAYVVPAVGVVDRSQVRREVARLTTDIRVETENLEILKQFSFVPFRDGKIYQSEQRIAGLRRERDALLPLLNTNEVLRAPTDGVISASTAVSGKIVHPAEVIFQVINPKQLWIEALAPDPTTAENAQRVATATALTPEGQTLALTFVGSGLALQQQSTPILFRIDNPPAGLRVGRPVTVAVESENRSQRGLPITRDALTIGADGVQEVWEQSEPEVFLPHAVHTRDIDGKSVLVVDGLKEGSRVVVNGVRLLAQLQ
jgi:hypothetical protein